MRYTTTVTSKGTITIAAPLRKALGIKPGQKKQLVLDAGTNMQAFQAKRAAITRRIPEHLKGLPETICKRQRQKLGLLATMISLDTNVVLRFLLGDVTDLVTFDKRLVNQGAPTFGA